MTGINHVAAYVSDLEKAREFFEIYFNATPNQLYHNPRTGLKTYFLTFEDGTRLEIMTRPDLKSTESDDEAYRYGYTHLAFSVGSREAVDAFTARLAEGGYAVVSGPRVTGDGCYESSVRAVDGLMLEITE